MTEVLDSLQQVGDIALRVGANAILDGGDFFDPKVPMRISHKLMQRVISLHSTYPCPVYANVGNHDCRQSQLSALPEGPLGSLMESGVFKRCYTVRDKGQVVDRHSVVFDDYARKVKVEGIPYHGPKYDMSYFKDIQKGDADYLVVMAHVLASPQGGSMFAGEDIVRYSDLLELNPEVDLWCFLPGTRVLDWNGRTVPIENIQSTLAVMSRNGGSASIEKIHPARFVNEDVYKFDVEGLPNTLITGVTKEHPFLAVKNLKCRLPSRSQRACHPQKIISSYPCNICTEKPVVSTGWVESQHLQEGDYVGIPVPDCPEFTEKPNPKLAYLLGLYLAEGHILQNRKKEPVAGVAWSFHENETHLHNKVVSSVKEIFGLDAVVGKGGRGRVKQVRAYGKEIANWFVEHGGRYSHQKSFSSVVWSWSKEDRMSLLLGWIEGDGHVRILNKPRVRNDITVATVSQSMATQMFLLSLSLGLRPFYRTRPEKTKGTSQHLESQILSFYGSDAVNLAEKIGVGVDERTKTKVSGFFHGGLYFSKIRKITKFHYTGPVYNIRTSNEEYVAGLLITHNCFGHWHQDQGVTEIAPNKWVVNIGSLTRGSLTQDNITRIPGVAVISFGDIGSGGRIGIQVERLNVRPAEEVFDLQKRVREEAKAMTIDAFVNEVQDSLTKREKGELTESIQGMNIPNAVKERTLELLERASKR